MNKNPIPQLPYSNLFATPASLDDLLARCEQYTGSERAAAMTSAMLALNLAQSIVEKNRIALVRECAEIADKAEPYKASDLIKKHFGVE